jgi:hypothetical protein
MNQNILVYTLNMMPCSLVNIYRRFRETFRLDEDGDYRSRRRHFPREDNPHMKTSYLTSSILGLVN